MPVSPTYIRLIHTGKLSSGKPNPNPVVVTDLLVGYGHPDPGPPVSVPVGGFVDVLLTHSAIAGQIASYAQQGMLSVQSAYQRVIEKNQPNGYCGLDDHNLVETEYLGAGTPDGTKFLRGDRTWSSPTSAPLPHAATHQNGGDDEIATSTPGAFAIPKAGATGKLDSGWILTTGGISVIRIPLVSGTYSTDYTQGVRSIGPTYLATTDWTADGGTYSWTFQVVLQASTTGITVRARLWNITDNELVTAAELTHTGDTNYTTKTSGALTAGSSAGNLKNGKIYKVLLDVSAGGSSTSHVATIGAAYLRVQRS